MRRRTWAWIGLTCLIAAIVGGLSYRFHRREPRFGVASLVGVASVDPSRAAAVEDRRAPTAAPQARHVEACEAKHRIRPPRAPGVSGDASPSIGGECSTTHCGNNGVWLGEGVAFRTLHLRPERANEEGLRIAAFLDRRGRPLQLQVDGDVLRGVPATGPALSGDELEGATLYLSTSGSRSEQRPRRVQPPTTPHVKYELEIHAVRPTVFWATCEGCTPTFPRYELVATDLDDGCQLELCAPGLDGARDAGPGNVGTAVIVRGDLYDDLHQVTNAADATNPHDDDVFNIACMGTALSKLHLLRHTVAARRAPGDPPPPSALDRQAMLRLLTADYCGDGSAFTREGLPIKIGFANPTFALAPESGYALAPGAARSIDALWSSGGATCIGTPRLLDLDPNDQRLRANLEKACKKVGRSVPPPCETIAPPVSLVAPFGMSSYAASGNPATRSATP